MSAAIVGGGIVGLSAAFHLRRADRATPVTVVERARVGAAASGASAAGVRVMGRHPAERALALESLGRWPDLSRELGADTRYRRTGGVRVALEAAAWADVVGWVEAQRADGVPLEIVDEPAMRRLVPGLSPACLGGVHCAIDGQAEAMPTVLAFAAAARRLGAIVEEGTSVRRIVVEGDRAVGVERADGSRAAADVVILTAGAWSSALLAPHGVSLPTHPRALQMLLTVPAPRTLAPVLGAFERRLSLKQLDDGAYLIGGGWPAAITAERDNRSEILDDSVRGSREVAAAVYPAVAACGIAQRWAGMEAFTADELPLIGFVPGMRGLLVATGFSGHGFALAPAVGDLLARLALRGDDRASAWQGLRLDRIPVTGAAGTVRSSPHIAAGDHP